MTESLLFPRRTTGEEVPAPAGGIETLALAPASLHGHSIRSAPRYPNPVEPTGLYLIYFTTEADGTPRALHIYDPSISTDIATEESKLYAIAKQGGPSVGRDFENLRWEYPTYISIVLDVDDHKFYWRDPEGYDPIMFIAEKERDETATTARAFHYEPNYSFYNAVRATVREPASSTGTRPVLRFTNYHKKNQNGDDFAPGEKAAYCMNIQLLATYGSGREWKHIIDPDSENQGPGGGP